MGVYNSDWLLNQIRGQLMSSARLNPETLDIEVREDEQHTLLMEMTTLMIC